MQLFYQTIILLAQSSLVDNHFHTMIPNTYVFKQGYGSVSSLQQLCQSLRCNILRMKSSTKG